MNVEVVETLLTDLLASTVAVLENPPARRFVAHGLWAHDCESVTVKLGDLKFETMANVNIATASLVTLHATIVRCYNTADEHGEAPAAATIQVDALSLADDAADLMNGLCERWAAGTLFPNVPEFGCGTVDFPGLRAIGPEGGLAGWECTLIVRS